VVTLDDFVHKANKSPRCSCSVQQVCRFGVNLEDLCVIDSNNQQTQAVHSNRTCIDHRRHLTIMADSGLPTNDKGLDSDHQHTHTVLTTTGPVGEAGLPPSRPTTNTANSSFRTRSTAPQPRVGSRTISGWPWQWQLPERSFSPYPCSKSYLERFPSTAVSTTYKSEEPASPNNKTEYRQWSQDSPFAQ
jgi:hypothetical protein